MSLRGNYDHSTVFSSGKDDEYRGKGRIETKAERVKRKADKERYNNETPSERYNRIKKEDEYWRKKVQRDIDERYAKAEERHNRYQKEKEKAFRSRVGENITPTPPDAASYVKIGSTYYRRHGVPGGMHHSDPWPHGQPYIKDVILGDDGRPVPVTITYPWGNEKEEWKAANKEENEFPDPVSYVKPRPEIRGVPTLKDLDATRKVPTLREMALAKLWDHAKRDGYYESDELLPVLVNAHKDRADMVDVYNTMTFASISQPHIRSVRGDFWLIRRHVAGKRINHHDKNSYMKDIIRARGEYLNVALNDYRDKKTAITYHVPENSIHWAMTGIIVITEEEIAHAMGPIYKNEQYYTSRDFWQTMGPSLPTVNLSIARWPDSYEFNELNKMKSMFYDRATNKLVIFLGGEVPGQPNLFFEFQFSIPVKQLRAWQAKRQRPAPHPKSTANASVEEPISR